MRHVQRAGLLRWGWPEQVRRKPDGRRHLHSEDVRGLSGPLRSSVRRLRRRDVELPSLHWRADLRRRRYIERVWGRDHRRRRRPVHSADVRDRGGQLREALRRVRWDPRLREQLSERSSVWRRRRPKRLRRAAVHPDHQLPCWDELRVRGRWLRRHRLMWRRVHRARHLRGWRSAQRVRRWNDRRRGRRHVHTQDVRRLGQKLRSGGRWLRRPHRELRHVHRPRDVRRRRRSRCVRRGRAVPAGHGGHSVRGPLLRLRARRVRRFDSVRRRRDLRERRQVRHSDTERLQFA